MSKVVWFLFDGSGIGGLPWAEDGYTVYCFNADEGDHGSYSKFGCRVEHHNIHYVNVWINDEWCTEALNGVTWGKPVFIAAWPPCTDMAVSGARHFKAKLEADPECQNKAVAMARIAEKLGDEFNVPYMIENPVSVLSTLWRKPDYYFEPWEYAGYLPNDDNNPFFPDLIPARDLYPKKTCLWTGNGFIMPEKKPIVIPLGYSEQFYKLGGKSIKTKTIRSLTPRGFARAVFEANKGVNNDKETGGVSS